MSAESNDIEVFARILAKVAAEYAKIDSSDDRSLQFLDEVTLLFDEYLARSSLNDESGDIGSSWWQRGAKRVSSALASLVYATNYGTLPLRERLTEVFQTGLEKQGRITPCDRRTLNIYRMIRFHNDGSCEVGLARADAYQRALLRSGVIAIAVLVATYVVARIQSGFLVGLPMAYTLGALLGWLVRDTYESAWGRDRLARRLAQQLPFLRLYVATG